MANLTLKPGTQVLDIVVNLGDDWIWTLSGIKDSNNVAVDITGWHIWLEVRAKANSPDPALVSLSDTDATPSFVIDATAKTITCSVPRSITSTWPKTGVYSIKIADAAGKARTWYAGAWTGVLEPTGDK